MPFFSLGSSGGSGSISIVVDTFADLPDVGINAGKFGLVRQSTGVWFVNRKEKGLYYSDGISWSAAPDILPIFTDEIFRVFDDQDDSKKLRFVLDNISSATTRSITMPDSDVDLSTIPAVRGGSYTPVLTALNANTASYSVLGAKWVAVDEFVSVVIRLTHRTVSEGSAVFSLTLPETTVFSDSVTALGTVAGLGSRTTGVVTSETGTATVRVEIESLDTATYDFTLSFMYET